MLRQIKKIVKGQRHNEFLWRYGFNFRPSINYKLKDNQENNASVEKIVNYMNRDGIAISSIDELLTEKKLFVELESAVERLLESRMEELQEIRSRATDSTAIGEKTFNVELLGSEIEFDPENIFAKLALDPVFLNIANAYFKMQTKLRYYNVWQTFATDSAPRESQLWHFDREDNYILKIFLYLRDVDEGGGPFTYAPKTHRKGILWGHQPEYSLEKGVMRSTDEQMAQVVPTQNWIKGTGKKGTIIFADTRGFHKGGEARKSDRLMFTAMFTSAASDSKRLIRFSGNLKLNSLTKNQICALEIK